MSQKRPQSRLFVLVAIFCFSLLSLGQEAPTAARRRVTAPIDANRRITLEGNVHPYARAQFDNGAVSDTFAMKRMLLVLSRSEEQEKNLQQLLDDQQTPDSPRFRQWVTPEQFGKMFGPADADVQAVTAWLGSQGFHVDRVSNSKNVVEFSGNAKQVRQAFHTQIRRYTVAGKVHFANSTNPEIPAALAPVVKGIASLNNFDRRSNAHKFGVYRRDLSTGEVTPEYTLPTGNGNVYAIGPADFATIYNTQPLQQANITGSGQTIAVVGASNVHLQDIADFRNMFGLGPGNTSVEIDGDDPGIVEGAEFEALLDLEWANAAAPGASVVLVAASGTESTGGLELAAQHVIERNMASVLSVSFGFCEAALGNAANQLVQNMWQQAAAQGITVVVSSGDSGSAGCEDFNTAEMAASGIAVSGLASTPYNVAAGGTDFNYSLPESSYWSTTNNQNTLLSAKSYIPEAAWNSSCAANATTANPNVCPAPSGTGEPSDQLNVLAGSGGPSTCSSSTGSGASKVCQGTPKPSWQSGPGVPQDGVRDIPDISLFSAINSKGRALYVLCAADHMNGYPSCQRNGGGLYFLGAGGTSVAAPAFAGIVALANQKANTRLGNVNYLLYSLAAQPGASCSSGTTSSGCIFHDVVQGNISVPCVAGSPNCSATTGTGTGVLVDIGGVPAFGAYPGYDFATGLGSVDGTNLVNAIASAVSGFKPSTTALTLNGSNAQLTAKHGDPISVAASVTPSAATGQVALVGGNGGVDRGSLSGGVATWSTRLFPGGNYNARAHYGGDGIRGASDSNAVPVLISPEASKTFVNLVTFDVNGNFSSYNASTAAYGSPYILRMDVADSGATYSSGQGISSNCSNKITSCATGQIAVTANGSPLDAGSFPIAHDGIAEDFAIQLSPGTYNLSATYAGDASYSASSGTNSVVITKAPTTTEVTLPNSSYEYGNVVPFDIKVTAQSNGDQMNGSLNYVLDGQTNSAYGVPGPATGINRTLSFSGTSLFLAAGQHTWVAKFSGDSKYAASESQPVTLTIVPAKTTITITAGPNPGVPRAPVTLTALLRVNGIYTQQGPSGTVTFLDNGAPIGTVSATSYNFSATLSYTFPLGSHRITASYSGDSNFESAVTDVELPLSIQDKIPSTSGGIYPSLNPSVINYPITLQAYFNAPQQEFSPNLTGTVSFADNGVPIPGTVTYVGNLSGMITYSFATAGTHNVTATYSGDVNYEPYTVALPNMNVLEKLQPTVGHTEMYFRPVVNQSQNLIARVYGVPGGPIPSGPVTFFDNGVALAGKVTNSIENNYNLMATMPYTFTSTGVHNLSAQFGGDTYYVTGTSGPIAYTIQGPIWLVLGNAPTTINGGTFRLFLTLFNNTQNNANISVTCASSSTKASCVSGPATALGPMYQGESYVDITVPPIHASGEDRGRSWPYGTGIVFAGVFLGTGLAGKRSRKVVVLLIALLLVIACLSCGGGGGGANSGSNGGGGIIPPPTSAQYTFTITASDGSNNTAPQTYTVTVM